MHFCAQFGTTDMAVATQSRPRARAWLLRLRRAKTGSMRDFMAERLIFIVDWIRSLCVCEGGVHDPGAVALER